MGIGPLKLKANCKYVIIPCTSKPKEVAFSLAVFAEKEFMLEPLTQEWEHITTVEGQWKASEGTAGGSPNHPTFITNPQYALRFKSKDSCRAIVELMPQDTMDSVGFLVIRRDGTRPDVVMDIRDTCEAQ